MPKPIASPSRVANSCRARELSLADVVVMGSLAADDAAERDKAVEPATPSRGKADRRRHLEGARHLDALKGRAGGGDDALGALPQPVRDMTVVGRLDEEKVRRSGHRVLGTEVALSRRAT